MKKRLLPFVLGVIEIERDKQDKQWGGADHDDEHTVDDWREQIEKHRERELIELAKGDNANYVEVRDRIVKIAALAAASIESQDRIRFDQITKDNSMFEDWLKQIQTVGYFYGLHGKDSQVNPEHWQHQFDDGATPLEAVISEIGLM